MNGPGGARTLLVIGGGAAAFAAATAAHERNVPVTIVNDGLPLGGTCVNVGCVPTKALLAAARQARRATGTVAARPLLANARALSAQLQQRHYTDVAARLGIEIVSGRARFVRDRTVTVGRHEHAADAVIVATGARPRTDSVRGLDDARVLTHRSIIDLDALPDSLVIVGAGPLGVEFADIAAGLGVRDVALLGRVLPTFEPEAATAVAEAFTAHGVRVVPKRAARVAHGTSGVTVTDESGGTVHAAAVFNATGVAPNTDALDLGLAGVATSQRGFVTVDAAQRTSAPGVFAAGDVTGTLALETVAAKQGRIAGWNAAVGAHTRFDARVVPHAVFTDPEIATVGWTEHDMMQELGTCDCRTVRFAAVPRALADGDTRGFVKLLAHPQSRRIVGATVVAANASDLIHLPAYAMQAGFTLDDLIDTVHVFPTRAEAWKLAALAFDRDLADLSCCIV